MVVLTGEQHIQIAIIYSYIHKLDTGNFHSYSFRPVSDLRNQVAGILQLLIRHQELMNRP